MDKQDLRIVYMGTPDFAVESLKCLVEGGFNIVGVITMPDKPIGRHGSVLQPSPVKQYAVEKGLKVLQPEKLKDEAFIEELRSLNADLQIVVAFRMLPEVVWSMPRLGTFNLHASLLPQYRGAAPLNWAIINGEKETGITTFFLKHEIDTGKVIQQVRIPIEETDNVGIIHDKLMMLGGKLVIETVDNILAGTINPVEQSTLALGELKPAPKIFRETCQINWKEKNTKQIYDFIRGLSPYPAAWTTLQSPNGKTQEIKIYEATKESVADDTNTIGTIITDGKNYLKVRTSDGYINIKTLQLSGKRRMDVNDFLRGFKYENEMRMC